MMVAAAEVGKFLLKHWRAVLVVGLLLLIWWLGDRNDALEQRIKDKDQVIENLEATIEQRDSVMRTIAALASEREQKARQAFEQARAEAGKAEAEIARLRAAKPATADECKAAEALLRDYRSRKG